MVFCEVIMLGRLNLITKCFSVHQTRTATALSFPFLVMVVIVIAAFIDCILKMLILLRPSPLLSICWESLDEGRRDIIIVSYTLGSKTLLHLNSPVYTKTE